MTQLQSAGDGVTLGFDEVQVLFEGLGHPAPPVMQDQLHEAPREVRNRRVQVAYKRLHERGLLLQSSAGEVLLSEDLARVFAICLHARSMLAVMHCDRILGVLYVSEDAAVHVASIDDGVTMAPVHGAELSQALLMQAVGLPVEQLEVSVSTRRLELNLSDLENLFQLQAQSDHRGIERLSDERGWDRGFVLDVITGVDLDEDARVIAAYRSGVVGQLSTRLVCSEGVCKLVKCVFVPRQETAFLYRCGPSSMLAHVTDFMGR